jgi:hypothetical protein
MSPTMFFADARGLPFVVKKADSEYGYRGDPFSEIRVNSSITLSDIDSKERLEPIITDICKFLTIPKLHDFMAETVHVYIMHDNIQKYNVSPVTPKYGIDTNRDYHNLLKSTQAFNGFIDRFLRANAENSTVIMLHGHDDAKTPDGRINNPRGSDQGTVFGPYTITTQGNQDYGSINIEIKKYVDFMTSVLFGYQFISTNTSQANYFFGGTSIVTLFKGEWARKLYGDVVNAQQRIPCFDIELSESYRDGTRGKTGGEGTSTEMGYDSDRVLNRGNRPFFRKNANGTIDGRFAEVNLQNNRRIILQVRPDIGVTISFMDFLEIYFKYRSNWNFPRSN